VSADTDPSDRMPPAPVLAVLVAAGASSRMGGLDKLDALLVGRPVLRRSVDALAVAGVDAIAVVTSPSRLAGLASADWLPDRVVAVVAGGARRQDSVAAGVAALEEKGLEGGDPAGDPIVLVHDAARPLVAPALVRAVARATFAYGAAIPVLPVTETLKRLSGDRVGETVDRTSVVAAQTPQGVRLSLLRRAYAIYPPSDPRVWTDEASLLEACRIPVHAIDGEWTNLKVTIPADLERAQVLLGGVPGSARAAGRVGLGIDGHSDGDAVLHAVADALLGAAGLGDLGRLFPADQRTPAGIDSNILLATVAERVGEAGWSIANVDVTIVAARPRLAARLPEMEAAIARAIGTETGRVNVKASTGNLGGLEGSGRWISAQAVAWIVPWANGPVETREGGGRP
jgi:2-C-methyl-D-erythritol 4-phosphate cytidylyltransferase/2-C-methyl-D-erythritol 2,4-cyclodiphosphate synthase